MDKRNSKENLVARVNELEDRLDLVYEAGKWGIGHVGMANYASREAEANEKLESARWDDLPLAIIP